MVCEETSKSYLRSLNTLVCMIALAIIGLGAYALSEYKHVLAEISRYAVYSPFALGGILLLLGILGCYSVQAHNKYLLGVYWSFMTIIAFAIMASGILLLVYVGYMDDIRVGDSQNLVNGLQERISDSQLAIYDVCCYRSEPKNTLAMVFPCNATLGFNEHCVIDVNYFNSLRVPHALCEVLSKITINGFPVVGQSFGTINGTKPSLCKSPKVFQAGIASYVEQNFQPIGILIVIASVLLLLADICTCILMCTNKADYGLAPRDDEPNTKLDCTSVPVV